MFLICRWYFHCSQDQLRHKNVLRWNFKHSSIFEVYIRKRNWRVFTFCMRRTSNSLQMSIYRKPTFVGQYNPWRSFFPKSQKLSLISCLVFRAFKIWSDTTLDNELKNIRKIFGSLGYPFDIVDKTIKKTISSLDRPKLFGPEKYPVYLRLPFLGNDASFLEDKVKDIVRSLK